MDERQREADYAAALEVIERLEARYEETSRRVTALAKSRGAKAPTFRELRLLERLDRLEYQIGTRQLSADELLHGPRPQQTPLRERWGLSGQ